MSTAQLDRFGCGGNTIKVAGGHYFDLLDPTPEMVDLGSIAAALSKICRFGGHCPNFYSVAEHCCHAMRLAERDGYTPEYLRAILLHDAAEAYVGDMVKPLKMLLPEFDAIEHKVEQAIAAHFGLNTKNHDIQAVIKFYDRAMLKAEKMELWPEDKEEWSGFAGIPKVSVKIRLWEPADAEQMFLRDAKAIGLL